MLGKIERSIVVFMVVMFTVILGFLVWAGLEQAEYIGAPITTPRSLPAAEATLPPES
ncbi:MAG: hypothetical protein KIS85_10055 [Anaerolineales bacterium]|nr:hypothetical protein [Anaerolineales bacterium]